MGGKGKVLLPRTLLRRRKVLEGENISGSRGEDVLLCPFPVILGEKLIKIVLLHV